LKIKVFTAETMQEVMVKVKNELGIDAVILHTRRFHKGGILGLGGKDMIEVTAAVEEKKPPVKPQIIAPELVVPKNVVQKYADSNLPQNPLLEEKLANAFFNEPSGAPNEDAKKEDEEKAEKKENPRGIGKKKFKRKKVKKRTETDEADETEKAEEIRTSTAEKDSQIEKLQKELLDMKKMLAEVISSKMQGPDSISLRRQLEENDVEEIIVDEICSSILDETVLKDKDTPEAAGFLADYFDKAFRAARGIELGEERTKIVALIGATGVGKTTTIAKIAANFVLEHAASVALITADTYRISAVEQLKTYSDIVGVPLEIVYTPEELSAAIEKHLDKKLILIDTAGRSQHNQYQLNELKELLAVNGDIEKHLVISATTKYRDAADILRKFALCEPDRVLFTKVDETSAIGTIINLAYHYPITISYLTNGQSVPDDISTGSSEYLAKLLLR
jgi:flagellar biosynthesis protein FlhF